MWDEIATWQEALANRPDLSAKTVALYTQDARRFATWLQSEQPGLIRNLTLIEISEPAPTALLRTEWNAVRRAAEQQARRDRGLALAIVSLMRFAGPRVSEVAALHIPDVVVTPRRGVLLIRRGKGLKHREIPLIQEAREPLEAYLHYREQRAERWSEYFQRKGEDTSPYDA